MTVQKLIAPIGISTKTVYKYFSDKEDLLKHCLLKHYSQLVQSFEELKKDAQNPVAALFKMWHSAIDADFGVNHIFYHDLNYYYPRLQDFVLQKFFKSGYGFLEDLIRSGVKQGYFRNDIVPEVVPQVISILYSSITRTGQFKRYKLTPSHLMQNTIDAYLRGICTPKGLKEFEKINRSL